MSLFIIGRIIVLFIILLFTAIGTGGAQWRRKAELGRDEEVYLYQTRVVVGDNTYSSRYWCEDIPNKCTKDYDTILAAYIFGIISCFIAATALLIVITGACAVRTPTAMVTLLTGAMAITLLLSWSISEAKRSNIPECHDHLRSSSSGSSGSSSGSSHRGSSGTFFGSKEFAPLSEGVTNYGGGVIEFTDISPKDQGFKMHYGLQLLIAAWCLACLSFLFDIISIFRKKKEVVVVVQSTAQPVTA